jgi:hypothetical protein
VRARLRRPWPQYLALRPAAQEAYAADVGRPELALFGKIHVRAAGFAELGFVRQIPPCAAAPGKLALFRKIHVRTAGLRTLGSFGRFGSAALCRENWLCLVKFMFAPAASFREYCL